MKSIFEEIEFKKMIFIKRTGISPQNLYLGHIQWKMLREEARNLSVFNTVSERAKYDGLPIFEVDAWDHLEYS